MLYNTQYHHGGDIYTQDIELDFSASINPLGVPPTVLAAMKDALTNTAHYPDPYCREAVRAISQYENVPTEMILMGNGAAELIYSFCDAFHPRNVCVIAPTFGEYAAALNHYGSTAHFLTTDQQNGFLPDETLLSSIENQKPDAVFLCNPNNPTGRLFPPAFLEKLCKRCAKLDCRIFLDECFMDLTDSPDSMTKYLECFPNLFILKAFTKSFALPGVRIGYLMNSDPENLQKLSETVQPWNVSVIAQAAAAACARESDYLRAARQLLRNERDYLSEALRTIGFWVCPSETNFILFKTHAGLDKALLKKGIAIRNCADFHGLSESWYRIAVRQHEENRILIQMIHKLTEKDVTVQAAA